MKRSELRRMIREEISRLNEKHYVLRSLKDILNYLRDEYAHPKVVFSDVKFKEVPEPGNPSKKVWKLDLKADGRPYTDWFDKEKDGTFTHRD
jgi:hypothetical protein